MNLIEATYMLKKAGAKLIKESEEDDEINHYRIGLRLKKAYDALGAEYNDWYRHVSPDGLADDDPDFKMSEGTQRLIASVFEALDPEIHRCYVSDDNAWQHGKTFKETSVIISKYEQPSKKFVFETPIDLLYVLKELQDKYEQGEDIDIYAVLANNSK